MYVCHFLALFDSPTVCWILVGGKMVIQKKTLKRYQNKIHYIYHYKECYSCIVTPQHSKMKND